LALTLALASALVPATPAAADPQPLTASDDHVNHYGIGAAGGTVSAGPWRLSHTVAQIAAGTVAAGPWRLSSGFQALFPAAAHASDIIFQDGFQAPVPTAGDEDFLP